MPANALVEDRGARGLDGFRLRDDLLAREPALDKVVTTVRGMDGLASGSTVLVVSAGEAGELTARALVKVLHHAGVNFAVLGEAEQCTGDAARRAMDWTVKGKDGERESRSGKSPQPPFGKGGWGDFRVRAIRR